MKLLRTNRQKIGLLLFVISLFNTPLLINSFTEMKRFCEDIFTSSEAVKCVFLGPFSLYFILPLVATVLLFATGLALMLIPSIKAARMDTQ